MADFLAKPYPTSVSGNEIQVGEFLDFDTRDRKVLMNNNLQKLTDGVNALRNLPEYANDAAAGTGGLSAGEFYRTAAGAVMVKL